MKYLKSKIGMLVIAASVACASWAHAESLPVRNCTWCHGTSAHGYMPAPRLAGQRAEYIENQLISFRHHTRDNPFSRQYMWGAAANLSPATARALAGYFSALPPKAANDGHWALAARGEAIYQLGLPDFNIVACVACHGPNAEGVREIPRLAGLEYPYLKRRLAQWGEGYHSGAARPMPGIASKLSPDEVEALASYLSFIR
jgi:cytochrome c553